MTQKLLLHPRKQKILIQNKTDSNKAQILQAKQKVVENTTNIGSKKVNNLNKKDFNRQISACCF